MNSTPLRTIAGMFLSIRKTNEEVLGELGNRWHLCLMIVSYWKLGSDSPTETESEGHCLGDYISKEWLPGLWQKYSWAIKLARVCEKIYISKRLG